MNDEERTVLLDSIIRLTHTIDDLTKQIQIMTIYYSKHGDSKTESFSKKKSK